MNGTISRLAFQSLFGQKRWWVLVALPLLLMGLCLLVQVLTSGDAAATSFEPVIVVFGLGLVLPLVSLLVTTGVLGPEIDDGSIVYLLSKPVSRYVVALSKLVVAVAVTVVLGAGSLFVAGLILDPSQLGQALAVAVGAAVAGTAYCAAFVMLSAINRHGMISGLIYVLVFEGLLASWLSGLRFVSVSAFGRRIAEGLDDSLNLVAGNLPVTYAWLASLVVIVAGCYVAGRRLSRFQLRGDE
ncbi:ABC transporter permease subunit [Ornithinimicrobium cavernae]|uniref:ABC transporter permease subunit n=1 Tax=Ornithinimicrobium cavernae TaxID=2666047 RepID=UPI000D699CA6|nr:ABC transporter permease subunit [Ornithinimicrobium cavernae]